MPTIRVYAADHYNAEIKTVLSGSEVITTVYPYGERTELAQMSTFYDLTARADCGYSPALSATAAAFKFDFKAVPELWGKKITALRGLTACLRERSCAFTYLGVSALHFIDYSYTPALSFLRCDPTGLPEADSINRLGNAPLGRYLQFSDSDEVRLHDGVQTLVRCGMLHTFPRRLDGRYSGHLLARFDGAGAPMPPYVDVTFSDAEVQAVNLSPLSGFIDEREINRFSWDIAPLGENVVGRVAQSSATIQWRKKGSSSSYQVQIPNGSGYYDFPAGAFPNGEIEWQVMVVGENGRRSQYSAWQTLSTIDSIPATPNDLTPNGEFRDGSLPVLLRWRHNSPLGAHPSAFEVQYKAPGGGFLELSGRVSSRESEFSVPPGTFPGGYVLWRVRDYTGDGVPSLWSEEAGITVRASPAMPSFRRVDTSGGRPTAYWLSTGQQAYELCVASGGAVIYSSGARFGGETQLTLPIFLEDGQYDFYIKIQNSFGLWSLPSRCEVMIYTKKPLLIALSGEGVENGAAMRFDVEVL